MGTSAIIDQAACCYEMTTSEIGLYTDHACLFSKFSVNFFMWASKFETFLQVQMDQ